MCVLLTFILTGFDTQKQIYAMQKIKMLEGSLVNECTGKTGKKTRSPWEIASHVVLITHLREGHREVDMQRAQGQLQSSPATR